VSITRTSASFIGAKRRPTTLENFNLSVGITDEFLHALDQGKKFAVRNPRTCLVVTTVDADELFTED
jgi:ribonucleoside-diphosphate reductase alpha chain